ncbi:MAG: GatB/YqeY domain-containing protein [Nitrospirae bacterium]|nr:MAG: GatB/YqeY domain-containing protein [Nitrospirota bacterium]
MEDIFQKIDGDLKEAMKARAEVRLSALRMLKTALKNRSIEKMGRLSDDEVIGVLSSLVKQRRESIEQFSAAGRTELADKEKQEIEVLQAYLPKQLSAEEIDEIIKSAIAECAAASPADMGKVMKIVAPKTKGMADGKAVNQRVKELLAPSS